VFIGGFFLVGGVLLFFDRAMYVLPIILLIYIATLKLIYDSLG
jgi:hypothetical protein